MDSQDRMRARPEQISNLKSPISDELSGRHPISKRLTPMSFEPIENYGVIGNMRSIALVGVNGSIDLLCYPNFVSPSVFAVLLDDERGGCFQNHNSEQGGHSRCICPTRTSYSREFLRTKV